MVGATPQFAVQSELGITNRIEYCTNLSQTNWVVLTNLLGAQIPYWFVDVAAPPASQRFYRVLAIETNSSAPPSGMALIPAGSFTMGDCMDDGASSDELRLHTVYVSAFYMESNLVSYTLWTNVYQWATNHGYSFSNAGSGVATNHPVQSINWYDCVKWCNARSEKEGLTPSYYTDASQATVSRSGATMGYTNWVKWGTNGYRLPTEAQWEKAARGGLSGHRFPWGDIISGDYANYCSNPSGYSYDLGPGGYNSAFATGNMPYTSPVGYFVGNNYGLHDMAGNLFEWCWDLYGSTYYDSSPPSDPLGPCCGIGAGRVLRGGSWSHAAHGLRCARRYVFSEGYGFYYMGFRCVRRF